MHNIFNIKLFNNKYENSKVLFVSREKIIFEHNNEIFCEFLKDVTYITKNQEFNFNSKNYNFENLAEYNIKSFFMPNEATLLLVKHIEPFYIFVNPNTLQEISIHSDDLDIINKINQEIKAEYYNITIVKDIFEGEELFQATVVEFPDIAEYDSDFNTVYNLMLDSINTTINILKEKNRPVPKPKKNIITI
tara:strand:- start:19310 stop:19882 length:573 start_codon:yes stop_codon:yes gene_type:complete